MKRPDRSGQTAGPERPSDGVREGGRNGASAATSQVTQAAIRAILDILQDAGTDPGSPEAVGTETSFLHARIGTGLMNAQTAKVHLEKMKTALICRAQAMHDGSWSHAAQAR